MGSYYGVQRSEEYLAHYGVKGMKWGVRKAIDAKDTKALLKHYRKASKKLNKLRENANLPYQYKERLSNAALAGVGGLGLGASVLGAKVSKSKTPAIAAGISSAGMVGLGIGKSMAAHYRTGSKGHAKAVQKLNDWQKEMHETFKGTKYANNKRPYKDEYSVVDYSSFKNGRPSVVAKIQGSKLTRNYKGSDKSAFLDKARNHMIKSPRTHDRTDPWDGWETQVDWMRKKKRRS